MVGTQQIAKGVLLSLIVGFGQLAHSSAVLIQDGQVFSSSTVNTYYNGLTGVSSSILSSTATITSSDLSGIDLFIAATPSNAYSSDEVTAIANYVLGGGNALLLGENTGFPTSNTAIGNVLTALSSSISIGSTNSNCGLRTATGGQLVGDTMTGVSAFGWGCASVLSGGVTELLDEDLTTILMASEARGLGDIVVMADGNITSSFGVGNQRFFSNLISFDGEDNGRVPLPATLALLGLGIAGLGYQRRKQAA